MRNSIVVRTLISFVLSMLVGAHAFGHPGSGIVINKQGEVFITDTGQGVWKVDLQGRLSYVPASRFHWMALDEAGTFANSPKTFGEWFERVTEQNDKPVVITCSDFPCTVNRDGNLYYADTRPGSPRIVRRTPDGNESVLASNEMFRGITGMAAGPDGSLYVTDASDADANTIRKITMDGTITTVASGLIQKTGAHSPPPETEVGYCRGLVVDSVGTIFVAATGSRRVLMVTPQGKVSTILQTSGEWSPTGVALFQGEVYVLEWRDAPPSQTEVRKAWLPRVRKIGRDGKVTTLTTVSR